MERSPFRLFALMASMSVCAAAHGTTVETALEDASRREESNDWNGVLEALEPHADSQDPDVDAMVANAMLMKATDGRRIEAVTAAEVQAAITKAEQCAARANGKCLNLLYTIYSLGMGVGEDWPRAVGYLRQAVAAGDLGAKANFAVLSYRGRPPIEKDLDLACRYFRELVDTPVHAIATYYLGVIEFRGQCGRAPDRQAGLEMIQIAANQGIRDAERDIGKNYEYGWTTEPDKARALEWYEKAAAHGDGEAAWNVGMAYVNGTGREHDAKKAVDYFQAAATAGYGRGKISLGVMYATGDGVERDHARAKSLYEEAARDGEPHAYRELAVMYAFGEGVPIDLVQAFVLYAQAIELGDTEDPGFRARLEKQMTAQQMEEASHRIEAWKAGQHRGSKR